MLLRFLGSTTSRSLASLRRGTTAALNGRQSLSREGPASRRVGLQNLEASGWGAMQYPPSRWGHSSHSAHFPSTPSLPLLTPQPPPSSLQSSRPHPPKATGTEDSPGPIRASSHPSRVPISATGSPLCLPRDPEGTQAHPTLRLTLPHSPQLLFIQSCQFSSQISLYSPRAPALYWPGPFPAGSLQSPPA